jgi:hypothetical protein
MSFATDAHDRIENRCQERDRVKQERHNERDYDYYDPFYDQSHRVKIIILFFSEPK